MKKGLYNPPVIYLIKNSKRLLFIMRCSFSIVVIQMIFISILVANTVFSQDLSQKINLRLDRISIRESLMIIEKSSDIKLVINDKLFDGVTKKVNYQGESLTVKQALLFVLKDTGLAFKVTNGFVALIKAPVFLRVNGVVKDAKTSETLPAVTVKLNGSSLATSTDIDGKFSLLIPESGGLLSFSSIGYKTKTVTVNKSNLNLTILLQVEASFLNEVSVMARRRTNTNVSVLEERKSSSIVQDAISSQQMERTASITTTQALQRVSGVTVTDDKYVAIRGLGDRSVIGQLNGIRLASSDPDRSAIPLDLIPASLLDNITIFKTFTPDKPADAAAGIVELKTKSIPDQETLNITVQSGTNSQNRGQINSFYNSEMGILGQKVKDKGLSQDFKNLGSLYNNLSDIQSLIANSKNDPASMAEANRIDGIMKSFDPVLTTKYKEAPINQMYSVTYGNSYTVFKNHKLGVIAGLNYYNRSSDTYDGELNQWSIYQGMLTGNIKLPGQRLIPSYITPNSLFLGKYLNYKDNTGTQRLNYGFLGGLAYRFSPGHEISFQYVGSRGAETQATNLHGAYDYTGFPGTATSVINSLKQTYRTLNTYNFQGEHRLLSSRYSPRLSYNLASSTSNQDDPDYRYVNLVDYMPDGGSYYREKPTAEGDIGSYVYTKHKYALASGYVNGYGPFGIIQADPNGRRWRSLTETNYNYKADLSIPFPLLGRKQELKFGVNYLFRKRDFSEYVLSLPGSNFSVRQDLNNVEGSPDPAYLLYGVNGNLDQLISGENVGIHSGYTTNLEGQPMLGGFLYNAKKSPNNYKGFYETNAGYGMLDLKATEQLRFTGGVRFEKVNIQSAVDTSGVFLDPSISAPAADGSRVSLVYIEPNTIYKTKYKPYYSLNFTYTLKENMNFRAGYNTTVARPELREVTNVFDFNPFLLALVVGNPDLIEQDNKSYDFRWEWFPKKAEVISASFFYKEIVNQLTRVYKQNSQGLAARFPEFPAIEFQNNPNKGKVYGIELELVKDLGTLWSNLQNFNFGMNLLIAQSDIKKTPERLIASRTIDRNSPENSPLFEQAPFSINTNLNYTNLKRGSDITVSFNMVGERLIQVNLTGEPDIYTRPQALLDLVVSQRIYKNLVLKGYGKNILDNPLQEVYANPETGGKYFGSKYIRRSYKTGSELMLGLNWSF